MSLVCNTGCFWSESAIKMENRCVSYTDLCRTKHVKDLVFAVVKFLNLVEESVICHWK
jgi:hypothetical protein